MFRRITWNGGDGAMENQPGAIGTTARAQANAAGDVREVAAPPKLLDQVRERLRLKHYSYRTEQSYVGWLRRFILFHGKRHPRELGAPEVTAFLTHLAVKSNVAAATQNQALAALLFLYKEVLGIELPWLDGIERAKKQPMGVAVSTHEERAFVRFKKTSTDSVPARWPGRGESCAGR